MDPILDRLGFAQSLARKAGLFALEYSRDELGVDHKGVQDRITRADRAVQDLIQEALADAFAADGFLGEESTIDPDQYQASRRLWVVDPIDGTDCFIFGIPSWSVSIAWIEDGLTKVGVVFDPIHDEMFAGALGHGAYLNGTELVIPQVRDLTDGLVGIGHSGRVNQDDTLDAIRRLIADGGIFHRCGSGALSLAWVAAGRLIGYFEPHMNSWDCLAGLLMVSEAGGWTSDFLGEDGLLRGNYVAAAAPGLAGQIAHVGQIADLYRAEDKSETTQNVAVARGTTV